MLTGEPCESKGSSTVRWGAIGKVPDLLATRWSPTLHLVDEDVHENERALEQGSRLFSAYGLDDGTRIWVITEYDRSATTILLPLEY